MKLQADAGNLLKKETLAQVFSCELCEISKKTFSERTPLVAASVNISSCATSISPLINIIFVTIC